MPRRLSFLFVLTFIVSAGFSQSERFHSQATAWEKLLSENPAAADDPSISWRDRLILYALTPEQARAYYDGADATSLMLERGQTLAEYLDDGISTEGNVYVHLPAPCSLFSDQVLYKDEVRGLEVRGEDLSEQGGARNGCEIPEAAVALMIQLEVEAPQGGRIKLWSSDMPEPAQSVVSSQSVMDSLHSTTLVSICRDDCPNGEIQIRSSEVAHMEADVVGYFRPMTSMDQPGGGILFSTEGASNNFFGTGAGASNTGTDNSFFGAYAGNSNTSGYFNSFFGANAGFSNTGGSSNSFFGHWSGYDNTTGEFNSFFGSSSGDANTTGSFNSFYGVFAGNSNTEGSQNAFFGDYAGYGNSTGWYNSFFGSYAGFSNSTGSRNAFFGDDAGQSNTEGSINSFFGSTTGEENTVGTDNSFFGAGAGRYNTEGCENAFFGRYAGDSNISGDGNTYLGASANGTAALGNATAVGYQSYVTLDNSLVLGSINGVNGATSDVNVGIGTTAPAYKLDLVNGVGRIQNTGEAASLIMERTDGRLMAYSAGYYASVLAFDEEGRLDFSPEPKSNIKQPINLASPAMTILGNKRIGMGTKTPQEKLHVIGNILASGSIVSGSSRTLKKDINELSLQDALEALGGLNPVTYRYKADKSRDLQVGFIAEDVPELVATMNRKGISPMDIVAVLTRVVQEQQRENQRLRKRNDEQDRQIADIRGQLDHLLTSKASAVSTSN